MKRIFANLGFGNLFRRASLFSLIACEVGGAFKPVRLVNVDAAVFATQIRVISRWTVPAGSDSVRVQVSFGTQPTQNKQYLPTRTADTTFFVAVPGETSTGGVVITAVKIGRVLTPVNTSFGPIGVPIANWPAVTTVTVLADTL